ncbi:MAG: FTR1 family protein [Cyanophyceae cyanobacterium]
MDISAALPTFLVTLREGFEAALVVGIVLACLKKAQATSLYRWVYLGIGGGITASIVVGLFLQEVLQKLVTANGLYAPVVKESFEGILGLVAIAMLSWMLIWMTQQAKSVKSEVEGSVGKALAQGGAGSGIFLLVFIAVLREGFETVIFIVAKFQQEWTSSVVGSAAGLAGAVVLGILLFQLGVKINVRLFFQVMGVFLLLIVGGLVVGALKHFDAAAGLLSELNARYSLCFGSGSSCLLGPQVWNGADVLPDKQLPGIVLKALFGYRQTIYLGQAIAYGLFLAFVGGAYFQSLSERTTGQKTPSAGTS